MSAEKKTCFVLMGFGEKVDFATGRKLNLNASYENLIKPAVEDAGLECMRADEIVHSGNINVPMYERILNADLVIADLSTSNANAFYELGVRHALRPRTTIIIAEDQFKVPFDIVHSTVRTYKHLGDDIGASEARRFTRDLTAAIQAILAEEKDDSPVYTFLHHLRPPELSGVSPGGGDAPAKAAPSAVAEEGGEGPTHGALMQQVAEAKRKGDFMTAKALLSSVRALAKASHPNAPEDPYIIQQLALVTYKSKQPTPQAALEEARALLVTLDPTTSNDTETLGLWGAVHKRLWDVTENRDHLDEAVRGYERGFYLRNDYYYGINLAYLLNVRAAHAGSSAEAVADFVEAGRVRREVIDICREELQDESPESDQRFWLLTTMAEALLGTGDEKGARQMLAEAYATAPDGWMKEPVEEQLSKLRPLLADSPLKYVIAH